MGKALDGKKLPKGISQRADGRYHARATVKGTKIELYNKDLKQLKIDFEKAKADRIIKTPIGDGGSIAIIKT